MISRSKRMNDSVIRVGKIEVDSRQRMVMISGREIELHPKEFDLLYFLIQHPGWVYTKEQIYDMVYEGERPVDIDNIIYCLIYSLRKKLEENPTKPKFIQTVRGVGYRFCKE